MDVGEWLFGRAWRAAREYRARRAPEASPVAARLEDLAPRLTALARALTDEAIEIVAAEAEGGWRGRTFYLPKAYARLATPEENATFFVFRVAYLATQRKLNLNWPDGASRSLAESRAQAAGSVAKVLARLKAELPGIEELLRPLVEAELKAGAPRLPDAVLLWGKWMTPGADAGLSADKSHDRGKTPTPAGEQLTEREAPPKEDVVLVEVDREKVAEYTLGHNFEKIETVEDFNGLWRDLDGADDMDQHGDALDEANLRHLTRVDDATHSVYRADLRGLTTAPEVSDPTADATPFVLYDEWDEKRRAYRQDHCRVHLDAVARTAPGWAEGVLARHQAPLRELERRLAALRRDREAVRRRPFGEELDLDAVVDAYAFRRAGRTPPEDIYVATRKAKRDIALILLVDLSLSTDSYVDGARVLDVEREAVALFGEALARQGDRFQVAGFSSRTRNRCRFVTVKSFAEPWNVARDRLGALEPHGYTRIGPALRHAAALLAKEAAPKKWIVLLSDGKPTDYDRYEGRYGLGDVRQAVREAQRAGVNVHGLAVEARARDYLPAMLGEGAYRILPRPELLPEALAAFYHRVAGA